MNIEQLRDIYYGEDEDNDIMVGADEFDMTYTEEYVKWLEYKAIRYLTISDINQQNELLLHSYKEGFKSAVESIQTAYDSIKNKSLK